MTERLPITNLLLMLMLAGFLLVSGSLQSAFDCLTQADHDRSAAVRVDDCHLVTQQPEPTPSGANKDCHQGSPQHQDLAGPQLLSLNKLLHPMSGTARPQMPLFRAGAPLPVTPIQAPIQLAARGSVHPSASQQLRSLRTTILLI